MTLHPWSFGIESPLHTECHTTGFISTVGCVTLCDTTFATPWFLDWADRLSSNTFISHFIQDLAPQLSSLEIILPVPKVRFKKGVLDHFLFMICLKFCNSQPMIVVPPRRKEDAAIDKTSAKKIRIREWIGDRNLKTYHYTRLRSRHRRHDSGAD